jgi:DNA-binding NtrC family response regulator
LQDLIEQVLIRETITNNVIGNYEGNGDWFNICCRHFVTRNSIEIFKRQQYKKDWLMNAKLKIIVIDDEENVLSGIKRLFFSKHPEYHIELTNNPLNGIKNIKRNKYDLVITDLMMPNIDGLELIKKIREIDSDLKIIMMTGYATMKTALLAMREGACKYISKPFTREEFFTTIYSAVNEVDLHS